MAKQDIGAKSLYQSFPLEVLLTFFRWMQIVGHLVNDRPTFLPAIGANYGSLVVYQNSSLRFFTPGLSKK